jgi:hypothetical protein
MDKALFIAFVFMVQKLPVFTWKQEITLHGEIVNEQSTPDSTAPIPDSTEDSLAPSKGDGVSLDDGTTEGLVLRWKNR